MKSLIAKSSLNEKKAHSIPIKDLFCTFKQVDQNGHRNVAMVTESIKKEGLRYPIICWTITPDDVESSKGESIPTEFRDSDGKVNKQNKRKWLLLYTISQLKIYNKNFLNNFPDCFDKEGSLTKRVVYVVFSGGCRIAAAENLGYDMIDSIVYDSVYLYDDMLRISWISDSEWPRPDLKYSRRKWLKDQLRKGINA